ncbi:hypothetical protein LJC46_07960 [Desulfovibrio sp. OttesenSCG-928-G15]|nr:hypothetical protein [Desulfovibrio sp. OttesenSCG-928-G15]
MITIMRRYCLAQIPPTPLRLIPLDVFVEKANSIADKKIAEKLKKFMILAAQGDSKLNDSSLPKEDRFASETINHYFDAEGRYRSDFLLDSLGIQHFHIGYSKKTDDNLIFTKRYGSNLYLMAIGTHADMYIENEHSILHQALYEFGPQYYDSSVIRLANAPRRAEKPPLSAVKQLKAAGLTLPFVAVDGSVRVAGLGIATDRTPMPVVRDTNQMLRELVFYLYGDDLSIINGDRFRVLSLDNTSDGPLIITRDYSDKLNKKYLFTLLNEKSKLVQLISLINEVNLISGKSGQSLYSLIKAKIDSPQNQKAMQGAGYLPR